MAKEYPRSYRVADQIQQELAVLIRDELKDPRVSSLLTISSVDVSRDLSLAKVYFTLMDSAGREDTLQALTSGSGFLRRCLGRRMSLRVVPQLRFHYDSSIEEGARMSALIDAAVASNSTESDDAQNSPQKSSQKSPGDESAVKPSGDAG